MNTPRYNKALAFAKVAHGDQRRKYTGEFYWTHLVAVADLVAAAPGSTEDMVIAALLHDTLEYTDATVEQITAEFGMTVAAFVVYLTDPPHSFGNRAKRKAEVIRKMQEAPTAVKTVKLADLLDNTSTINEFDPDFAKVYLAEKRALLPALRGGDPALYARVEQTLDEGKLV